MAIVGATRRLKQLFSADWLNKIARESQFMLRSRDITPLPLVSALVASLGDGKTASIAAIHRTFNGICSETAQGVAYKPFHNRLRQESFATLMATVAQRAMALFLEPQPQVASKLNRFRRVLIHDGSSFAVHRGLASTFPGRFGGAAVECHLTLSLLEQQPLRLEITADTQTERTFLPEAATLAGSLLLADAGYISAKYMSEVASYGGCYLMRYSKGLNPTITQAYNATGKQVKSLLGLRFKALRRRTSRSDLLDLDVTWEGNDCRMVCYWHAREKRYLSWLTNLPRELFSAVEVMQCYRLRWQVELLFKELKSHTNLHRFATRQEGLVKGLIWASLLALVVKRFVLQQAQQETGAGPLSFLKMASSAKDWLAPIMRSLATRYGSQLEADFGWAVAFIVANCRRDKQSKARQDNSLCAILAAFAA